MGPIQWLPNSSVRILDQTRLPQEEVFLETSDYRDLLTAIRDMKVRGAPLIGVTAGYALALAAHEARPADREDLLSRLRAAADVLRTTRPTAVNLAWAAQRCLRAAEDALDAAEAVAAVEVEARRIHDETAAADRRIGANAAALIEPRSTLLTHCNTGALATGGYGTALGVVRTAWEERKLDRVYITETRPLLQGARLTAWELLQYGIPFTLVVDSAAGSLLERGIVQAVVVGADRIAANGDVANKIGTYAQSAAAADCGVPFYVAAPTSTIDLAARGGDDIPIEERSAEEVTGYAGRGSAPEGVRAANPAFDVTRAALVTAIVTEAGVARAPYEESLAALVGREAAARG